MSATSSPTVLTGLARALVSQQWLTEEEAENLVKHTKSSSEHFVTQLLVAKKIKAIKLAEFAATQFGFPYLDLDAIDPEVIPKKVLDPKLILNRRVVALYQRGNRLSVAVSDPTNLQAIDEIKFQTNQAVDIIVVEDDKLGKLITQLGESENNALASIDTEDLDLDFTDDESVAKANEADTAEIDDAPVVRYLQKILLDAINDGVSDIHFEPYEKFYRIRYRLDGILREVAQPP